MIATGGAIAMKGDPYIRRRGRQILNNNPTILSDGILGEASYETAEDMERYGEVALLDAR